MSVDIQKTFRGDDNMCSDLEYRILSQDSDTQTSLRLWPWQSVFGQAKHVPNDI